MTAAEPVLRWCVLATQVPAGGSLGGVVRYTIELSRALAAREDVVVSAVTTRAAADTMAEILGSRERVHTVPDLPTPALALAERYLPVKALRSGVDVVQGTKHLVPARTPALRVLTVHDMLLLDRRQDFGAGKRYLLPGPYRASIRQSDLLIPVSRATRARIAEHVPEAVDRARVVHLATSAALRTGPDSAVPALQGRRFALVVGDPTPRKNLRTVVTAWAAVRRRCPDVALAIAGPPSWGQTVLGPMFDRLTGQGAVVPLAQLTDAELAWSYRHAEVVLCPSLAEGFGLPAAEALDLGAPVIVSDDAALTEVAAGRARAIVPALAVDRWEDAVGDALGGRDRRDRSAAAPARTWADVADETVGHVREALRRRESGWAGRQPASASRAPLRVMSRSR